MAESVQDCGGLEASSNFAYHVLESCKNGSAKTLLVVNGEAVTGLQLHQRISAAVYQLRAGRVAPGDRVLITTSPSVDFFALATASFFLGGCLVVLDPAMGLERTNHCVATAAPAAWVLPQGSWFKYLKFLVPTLRSIPIHLETSNLSDTQPPPPSSSSSSSSSGEAVSDEAGVATGHVVKLVEPADCVPVEHALVTFTTGSTGLPKLLLRQHSFILNQSCSMALSYEKRAREVVGLSERDSVVCTNLALFSLHFLKVGATVLLYPSIAKVQPAKALEEMKKYGVTTLGGSPAFIHKLASHATKLGTTLPIRLITVGGAPVYRGMLRAIASATPEKKVMIVYGATEVEPVSTVYAEERLGLEAGRPDGHCVGRPMFDGSTRIIKILTDAVNEAVDISSLEVARGEIGEIVVSGWHVNTYQVAEKRLVRDMEGLVWLRTEDAGYMDEEGRLWLVGRVKWKVERDGKTFWSTAVEQKVMDRCSVVTFAAYLPHNEEVWLFLEAPRGLPQSEESALKQFLLVEGIPVDHFVVKTHIPKDRRHLSKPNTAVIFAPSSFNRYTKLVTYLLRSNPLLTLLLIFLQLFLIFSVIFLLLIS